MLFVSKVRENMRLPEEKQYEGLDKLKMKRSKIPAVTHVDHSARVQTVKRDDNPCFYDLLKQFYDDHGCPILINTSFNVRGEPIVCTPDDAYKCFMATDLDYLVMGEFFLSKG